MNWLNNLKVARKLALLIVVFVIALVSVGGVGYYFLAKTNQAMDRMYNEKITELELINENRVYARRIEGNLFSLMLTTNETENKALMDSISENAKLFDANLTKFEQMPIDDQSKADVKEMREILGKYREVRSKVISLASQNKNTEAYALYTQDAKPLADGFMKKLVVVGEETKKSVEEMNIQNHKDFVYANTMFVIVILSAILLGILLGVLITKRITKRLNDVAIFMDTVAKGDFTREVSQQNLNDKSEFGTVSRAVATMNKNVKDLIRQLANTSEQLAASSEELTASAEQSAQASNQVAGSVTEVAQGAEKQLQLAHNASSVVLQISNAITQVASNTETVSSSAEKTAMTANNGEEAIRQAVSQMQIIEEKTNATANVITELEDKSKQIGQIVDVISSISGQTNLLALNAAIEAARAGEAGRGFAVVAEEVRKLAEQSQDAAKQITQLISEVQAKTDSAVTYMNDGKNEVDKGARVVTVAGQSFSEIWTMVKDITSQIHEISGAIEEITSGTQDVVNSVQEIDDESRKAAEQTQTISAATEEQSASVEEIASSSRNLAKMAEELQVAIGKFKI
ncbi:methyl-accepting chemotaxis protein [Propionispora vibrioides]|uniref:Methyl-accepting chemotaxis protein n=1 Tax=Propionispora vibrioides TaxID=112903 RepID=A0A1H8XX01_9FIRM|nr:methyl-accepting chemotaxis protein [Propionispora vibrioides]SEP44366.1 methyl-accepting chemotaxis protein [Propionispora vibrioides]